MMELFIFDKFTIFEKLFDQMKVNSIHKFGFRIMFISERESINRKGLNKKSISSQSFIAPKAVEHLFWGGQGLDSIVAVQGSSPLNISFSIQVASNADHHTNNYINI